MPALPPNPSRPRSHRAMPTLLVALPFLALILVIAIITSDKRTLSGITDYDLFLVVGTLVHEGRADIAYHHRALVEAQALMTGADDLVPWAYPPVYNLVVAALAMLPRGLGYGLFTGTTMLAWIALLWHLAKGRTVWILIMLAPMMLTQILAGQNGFLTAALVAAFATLWLRGGIWAGLPLGLMAIKPHLALGLAMMVLMRAEWRVLAFAAATGTLLCLGATAVMGAGIWPAFLQGTREAGELLRGGAYQLQRMTSLYTTLHSLGLSPATALLGQIILALAAAGAIALAARDPAFPRRWLLALACAAGLVASPYSYDYDMAIFGVALALVAADLFDRARPAELAGLLALSWLSGKSGLGFAASILLPGNHALAQLLAAPLPGGLAPGGIAFLLIATWCARILTRG